MNSRTDFANLWRVEAPLPVAATVNPRLFRRVAAQRALALAGRNPRDLATALLAAEARAALDALTARFFQAALEAVAEPRWDGERLAWHHPAEAGQAWGPQLTNLEVGRLKASAKARALRCLVGVSIPGDGSVAPLVQLEGADPTTEGATVRAWADRARDRARVLPGLCTRAASGRPVVRVRGRRAPYRVPVAAAGPAPVPARA